MASRRLQQLERASIMLDDRGMRDYYGAWLYARSRR